MKKETLTKPEETPKSFSEGEKERAYLLLGGIRAADHISKNVSSQAIGALIEFQKTDLHEAFGFKRFADFLDNYEYSPMTKNEFYDRKKVFETEGAQLFDAFNDAKIPISTRKLLVENNDVPIYVDGDKLIVGEVETSISDNAQIKQVVQQLAAEIRGAKDVLKAKDTKIEKLSNQVQTGTQEYEELRRATLAANEGTPYQQALVKAVGALVNFAAVAKETPLVEKGLRGRDDLTALMAQMKLVRSALYLENFVFTDEQTPDTQDLSPLAVQAVEETGDWNDEKEI